MRGSDEATGALFGYVRVAGVLTVSARRIAGAFPLDRWRRGKRRYRGGFSAAGW
jgi:hypothetical protein